MSDARDDELSVLLADLVDTLRAIETEFEPRSESGLPRPPTPRELARFASEVGIPAAILVLRTNIEALKLLQRALRLAEGRQPESGPGSRDVARRARSVSRTTLDRLDDAIADLQDAIEGKPVDENARDLLREARELQDDVREQLDHAMADGTDGSATGDSAADGSVAGGSTADSSATHVAVDVDAELESIKDDLADDRGATDDGDDPADGFVDGSTGERTDDSETGSADGSADDSETGSADGSNEDPTADGTRSGDGDGVDGTGTDDG